MNDFKLISLYFEIFELVLLEVYFQFKEKSIMFLDVVMISVINFLWEIVGRGIVINDWYWKGVYSELGLRMLNIKIGVRFFLYKFGKVFDVKIKGFSSKEMYDIVYVNR